MKGCNEAASPHWARIADGVARVLGHDNPVYQAARTAARTGRADHFVRANQLLQSLSESVRERIKELAHPETASRRP